MWLFQAAARHLEACCANSALWVSRFPRLKFALRDSIHFLRESLVRGDLDKENFVEVVDEVRAGKVF